MERARNSATSVGRDRDEIRSDIAGIITNDLGNVLTNLDVGRGETALLSQLSGDSVEVGLRANNVFVPEGSSLIGNRTLR